MYGKVDGIGVPSILSPRDGLKLLATSVQFCWSSTEDGFGYELQWSQAQDFSDARSYVVQNLLPSNKQAYIPETPLSGGRWFCRVRGMTNDGIFGRWSAVHSFTTVTTLKREEQEREVSPENPLFIFLCGTEVEEYWQSLPDNLKPYSVMRIEHYPTDNLLAVCERAQAHEVPVLIQLVGPHDTYSGNYSRIPLSDVEYIFQQFPAVKGVQIVEQSCQGGLKQPRVTRYLIGMMRMAAAYGKVAVWADGHWHGNNVWIDAALHEELYRTISECREAVIPMWKMNCGWLPYSVQGAVSGLWAGGATANWGVEPESWFWYEAGFHDLGVQYGFKEGDISKCPAPFWGQMVLPGLSSGAAAYCIEPPDGVWSAPGKLAETGVQMILPLLSRIVDWGLIPKREQVLDATRIGYILNEVDSPWREDGGTLRTVYHGTYGLDHPFELIPRTGRYGWMPLLSPYTPDHEIERYSALVHAGSFQTPEDARSYFDRIYPADAEGTAWVLRAGNLIVITNHHENKDVAEEFAVQLDGEFVRLEGRLEVNSYLIIQQAGPGILRIHANGRKDRVTTLKLLAGTADSPKWESSPGGSVKASTCCAGDSCLAWTVSFAGGAVDLIVEV